MKETFGEYIHSLRCQNEMTLTRLADILGVDQSTLSKIENNKRKFSIKLLPKLADCFNLNVTELEKELLSEEIALLTYNKKEVTGILKLAEEKAILYKKYKN